MIGVQQDKELDSENQAIFLDELKKIDLTITNYENLKQKIDLIFVINYNKIIDVNKINHFIINLHIGLLPKYRGNSANAWAVINGEKKVGYTIHEISKDLDSGDIYYKYEYSILNDSNYLPAKESINNDIINNIEKTLIKVINGDLKPVSQNEKEFMYCTKLRPSFGVIKNWNFTTDYFLRKMYVFSPPLGTGLKFEFNNKEFRIEQLSCVKSFADSIGVVGAIVYIKDNSLWVKTKDNVISIDKLTHAGKKVLMNEEFKIGQIL